MLKIIIAIDGPAGSGKSTTAKLVAKQLGYTYIDTGAMYRTITYLALKNSCIDSKEDIIRLTKNTKINLSFDGSNTIIVVEGIDLSEEIRSFEVNQRVSDVAAIEEVRKELVAKQQEMGLSGGVVMEGRDIGSVVFPNAELKIFLTATIEQRAERRFKEYLEKGKLNSLDEIRENLIKRDKIDSSRSASPLKKGEDYFEVDTSGLTIENQVEIIVNKAKELIRCLNGL